MASKIIGVSGTNGSGKDVLGQILAEHYNYLFISVADLLRAEAKKRGLEPLRENLRTISAEWRRDKGLGVLVDMAVAEFKADGNQHSGLVLGSIRNRGEAGRLHELGGQLVWVDAEQKLRYERVAGRERDAESRMTYEQFIANESAEMNQSGDETTLGLAEVKAAADVFIENNGSLKDFRQAIEKALNLA